MAQGYSGLFRPKLLLTALLSVAVVLLLFSERSVVAQEIAPGASTSNGEIILAQSRGFNPFAPLQRLFGGKARKKKERTNRRRTTRRRAPVDATPKIQEIPKDPNAGVILVVGDRMARGVADGLKAALAEKPQIRVEPITQDKGGLTGENPPDWEALVVSKIRGTDVKAVVFMFGQHDLNKTFPGEPPIEFMTGEWLDQYSRQVNRFVRSVRQEKKPVVWVGLPPTRDELVSGDFTQLNSIFQETSEDRRVRYVDIWDIFLGEDGQYATFGPDVDGKNARLRTNNQIGFTWAGYKKVAFFVERELLRLLGGFGGLAFEGVEDDPNFIVLTGRTTSPETLLLGDEETDAPANTNSVAYQFFVKGEPLPPMAGRVDDPKMPVEGTSALDAEVPSGS